MVLKRKIEGVFIFPFVLIGRLISLLRPLKEQYQIFFLFPFYHTGGAEKYNAALANAASGRKAIIFFTRKSINTVFLNEFRRSGHRVIDISRYTDNKWIYFTNLIYRGIITGYINRQTGPAIVYNGQCNFAYKISPWVKKDKVQLEFIHTFNTFSYIRTPFLSYYLKTISSSKKTLNDHLKHYEQIKVPQEYGSRLTYILYGIDLPDFQKREDLGASILHILFAGRSTFEKRVHIVAAMAKKAADFKMSVQFDFMGEVKDGIPPDLLPYCNILGTKSGMEIFDTYRSCHILVVSSLFEGFPFVVMEAMSQGLAIVSTPVGDVPVHVANYNNGYIIPELTNEDKIVEEGIQFIKLLLEDRQLLQQISTRNQEEAYAKFNMPVFNKNYQSLFDSILGN